MSVLYARTIYYLPGNGGLVGTGLGEGIMSRGFTVAGRETVGTFRSLSFDTQVETIAEDLRRDFWREDARVVAVSRGAYLFLHAQARLAPFPGRVLLLSPIVGECGPEEKMVYFVPPRAGLLQELAAAGTYPAPPRCEVHVGASDWQSVPADVLSLGRLTGFAVNIVPDRGHDLGKDYMGPVLDRWLAD